MEASYVDLVEASHLKFEYMRGCGLCCARSGRAGSYASKGVYALARALVAEDPSGRHRCARWTGAYSRWPTAIWTSVALPGCGYTTSRDARASSAKPTAAGTRS